VPEAQHDDVKDAPAATLSDTARRKRIADHPGEAQKAEAQISSY